MILIHAGDRPSNPAGDTYFTGTVRFDPIDTGDPDCTVKILSVNFEPDARTNWHTYPAGQTLHIVSGMGLAGSDGQPVRVLRPGDTV